MVPFDPLAGFQPLAQRFDLGAVRSLSPTDMIASATERSTGAEVSIYRRVSISLDGFLIDVERARRASGPRVPRILDQLTVSHAYGPQLPILGAPTGTGDGFLILERCDGPSLKELCRAGALALADAGPMLIQLAQALQEPASGDRHAREFALFNALWTPRGLASLSLGTESYARDTRTRADPGFAARVPYFAPEQVRGRGIHERTEVYAYGVCCHRMLTGQFPHAGDEHNFAEYTGMIDTPFDPAWLPDWLPAPVRSLIAWTLERDPDQRPSVTEVVALAARTFAT